MPVHKGLHAGVEHGKDRYAHNHAENAEEASEDGDRKDNPEAGKPGGIAEDFRPEDIAVKLLDKDNQDTEIKRLPGINHQHKEGAGNTADPRTEKGNHIGHADNHAYQNGIRRADNTGADKADDADDNGVYDLAADKADEGTMDEAEICYQLVPGLAVKYGIDYFLCLSGKFFFTSQQINGDNKADNKVPERFKYADYAQGNSF